MKISLSEKALRRMEEDELNEKLSFIRSTLGRIRGVQPAEPAPVTWMVPGVSAVDEDGEDDDEDVPFGQTQFKIKPFDLRFQEAKDPEIENIRKTPGSNWENEVEKILVDRYKKNPTPENMEPLMAHFENNLEGVVRRWSNRRIPEPAVRGHVYNAFSRALDKYDPDKGTHFHTYLYSNYLNSGDVRVWGERYSSLGRVAKSRSSDIGLVRTIQEQYELDFGREATSKELAKETGISLKHIKYLQQEVGSENIASKNLRADHSISENALMETALRRVLNDFSPAERKIVEDALSEEVLSGRKTLTQVANEHGVSSQKISKLKAEARRKLMLQQNTLRRGF